MHKNGNAALNKILIRTILSIVCVTGALVSAGLTAFLLIDNDINRAAFGEWLASIHINIEMDTREGHNLSVLSRPMNQYYYAAPTSYGGDTEGARVIMHAALRVSGFHRGLFIRFPAERETRILQSIDNISVFIGNKLVYFSKNDIQQFDRHREKGYTFLRLPALYYTKSLVLKDWANYYGEYNIALKTACNFVLHPWRFFITYLFLFALCLLYRQPLGRAYLSLRRQPWFPALLLTLVTALGFALRINGYVRHSAWTDELYSATVAGNPHFPFIAAFEDGGNPPFYYLLLRFWFRLFGWSEETGTMLSVLLGTAAVPVLYLLVKRHCGRKAALLAAFFMAISGFAVEYSQEMRGYILKICLVTLGAILFFRFLKKQSLPNMIWYIIPSIAIANTHYYGMLFVMANALFYCLYSVCYKEFNYKKAVLFFAGNIVIALSCIPFLIYQTTVKQYYFDREEITISSDFVFIFVLIILATALCVIHRKKITSYRMLNGPQKIFLFYCVLVPGAVFVLAFLISFFKPMISYRYMLPVSFPFVLSACSLLVFLSAKYKVGKYIAVFIAWSAALSLYEGRSDIPGRNGEYYRESRAYIAADIAAHPEQKAAILNNTGQIARFYGAPDIPEYSPGESDLPAGTFDVLYVFNGIFDMHENQMYDELDKYGIDDSGILKIIPDEKIVVFKKYR